MDTPEKIYDIIVRYFAKEATPDELNELQDWLALDSNNIIEFQKLQKIYSVTALKKTTFEISNSWENIKSKIKTEKPKIIPFYQTRVFKIAASIIAFIAISFVIYQSTKTTITDYTAKNQTLNITLPDNSIAYLNRNSHISVDLDDYKEETRNLILKGEAFFEVEKNPEKPFIVTVSDIKIKVLGTSFDIKETDENVSVTVKTGKVKVFQTSNESNFVELVTNESVVFSKTSKAFKESEADSNVISWKTGVFIFEEETLENVVIHLNKHYSSKITVTNNLKNLKYTGTIKDLDFESSVKLLELTFNIKSVKTENGYLLKGADDK